jgi:exodeoxyribonuclease VII small subunit
MSKKMDLEVKLEKLEEIVESMDSNELNLDETIKSFESGLKLYKECKKSIVEAEKKIQILTEELKEEKY